jgi:oligopeptidase B
LTLLDKSFDGYEISHVDKDDLVVYRHKYTCPKEPIRISIENQTVKPEVKPEAPRYHEEEVFIHPHLRVTLLYKHKSVNAPCLLRGYGAYNEYTEVRESVFYYPLLERGFVIAIAHLRGGGEYGYRGYDQGRMSHKKNTFQDFIDTAHYLIDKKWTCRDKLAIWGRSFGGLMICAVLNQEPDLCKVALLGVPFVQPLETMKSDKMPVGIATQSELGNIQDPKIKKYIHSYSPLEHIQKEGPYPHMFIYTNRHDTSVPCQGPLTYYNAMKQAEVYRTGKRDITLYMDPRFGHNQGSLQKDKCDHYGLLFAYVLKYLNIL